MRKLQQIAAMVTIMSVLSVAQATICDATYHWDFYNVRINNGVANCVYRYCYYGCTYTSYQLPGYYRAGSGPWTIETTKPYLAHCNGRNNECILESA